MTDAQELPIYPTTAPAVFGDIDASRQLIGDVLDALADVIEPDDGSLLLPTPCARMNVDELRRHVLGWLRFFAAALADPDATSTRPDPDTFAVSEELTAREVVDRCTDQISEAIEGGVGSRLVTMTGSRMAADGVLAMALGEYLIHAWDIATATGQAFEPTAEAVGPAHEFLRGMVAPDHRGPDSGFFDEEVQVPDGAPPFDRLLGFAGRDPAWSR